MGQRSGSREREERKHEIDGKTKRGHECEGDRLKIHYAI